MLSKASQEILENTTNELKKIWVGKICIVIDKGEARHITGLNGNFLKEPHHYIQMATKDPTECDTFGYVNGKLVRPEQKPQKLGEWYFGDKSKNANIDVNSYVLVVDIVRTLGVGYRNLPGWAAIILHKEHNWKINLEFLAFNID